MWNLEMPNALNFGFDYYIFCLLGAAMYLPGAPLPSSLPFALGCRHHPPCHAAA